MCRPESDGAGDICEPMKPGPRRLFQAVQRTLELADETRMFLVDEAGRLIAVNLFVEEAVQERILDVKLMHRP